MGVEEFLKRAEKKIYLSIKRLRLKNQTPSIFSDNCNGGFICHDLGLRFNSPTVNCYMLPADYLRFLNNPREYLQTAPVEIHEEGIPYPIGMIGDVKVYFMHYQTMEQAREKWLARGARVNFDNLYVLMTDKNGCTEAQMREFASLPYPHKAFFSSKPHPDIPCAVFMKRFEGQKEVGILSDLRPGFWKRRYLDDFDYVSFLNDNSKG